MKTIKQIQKEIKFTEDSIEMAPETFASMMDLVSGEEGHFICPECGTLHPAQAWYQKTNKCKTCKDRTPRKP